MTIAIIVIVLVIGLMALLPSNHSCVDCNMERFSKENEDE